MKLINLYVTKTGDIINFILLPSSVQEIEKELQQYCPRSISISYDTVPSNYLYLFDDVYLNKIKNIFLLGKTGFDFNFIYHL